MEPIALYEYGTISSGCEYATQNMSRACGVISKHAHFSPDS